MHDLANGDIDPATARKLERIAEITRNVRATWFVLLGVLAFASVTLLGFEHADFFAYGRQTRLPLVGVDIPTRAFFLTTPILLASLYIYFHLQLRQLWLALAEDALPTTAGGSPVSELVHPGLITDWGLGLRQPSKVPSSSLDSGQRTVVWLLLWVATPIVLFGFWWAGMPAHAEWLTLANGAVLLIAVFVGRRTLVEARWRLARRHGEDDAEPPPLPAPLRIMWLSLAVVVAVISWSRTEGGLDHYVDGAIVAWNAATPRFALKFDTDNDPYAREYDAQREWIANHPWIPKTRFWDSDDHSIGAYILYPFSLAPVDLAGVALVPRDPTWRNHEIARQAFRNQWCRSQDLDAASCQALDGENRSVFERAWQEERSATVAQLPPLLLSGADLRGGNLVGVFAPGVDLSGARLQGANLSEARLEGADLSRARLQGANILAARLEEADVSRAWLEGADLIGARLKGADLRWARLDGADLSFSRLEGADLVGARLEGTDLRWARLDGANLGWTSLSGTDFAGSVLSDAEFLGVEDLVQRQLDGSAGNANTFLPRDAETGAPVYVWSCLTEQMNVFARILWTEAEWETALCNEGEEPVRVGRLAE